MSELKSSDYFIGLSVKVTLVRFANEELERLILEADHNKIDDFLRNLGMALLS